MTTISSILNRCLNELNLLTAYNALAQIPEVPPLQWQDELGRLRVWSGNIGAHKTGQSSLDYRLRDSSHIRNEILKLLQRMLDLFEDLHEVISEEDSLGEEIDFSDSELALDESPDLTEVQQIYHNLVDIINFLFRITMAIRQPSGHDQLLGVKIGDVSFFEPWAKQHISHKYPGADDYIVDRLSATMARQKAVLKYREKHHQKLSQGLFSSTKFSDTVATDRVIPDTDDQLQFPDTTSDSGVSQTSYAPSLMTAQETMSIPQLPKESANRSPFECPYCYHIITVRHQKDWARHIFHDLMPYVCVLDHCPSPSRPYDSRREWYHHLVEAHSLRLKPSTDFTCPLCKSKMRSVTYERNVGRHLEELALFVLPQIDTEDEDVISEDSSRNSSMPAEERNLDIILNSEGADANPETRNEINQISRYENMMVYEPEIITPESEAESPEPKAEIPEPEAESSHCYSERQPHRYPFPDPAISEKRGTFMYFCVSSHKHFKIYRSNQS